MEPTRPTSVARFGIYEISFQSGELRKAGIKIKVQQQPLRLLEILLEHPGEIVTREELRTRIWPQESFGDFDQAVNVAIAKLRGALGDSADNPRFIETIPRRGYRFIAQVSVVQPASANVVSGQQDSFALGGTDGRDTRIPAASRSGLRVFLVGGLSLILLIVLGFVIANWRRHAAVSVASSGPIRSLAVLPLE